MDRSDKQAGAPYSPFLLAAGGLACFFVGLGFGYWFWQRSRAAASALEGLSFDAFRPLALTLPRPAPRLAPSRLELPMSRDSSDRRLDVDRGFYVEPFTVGATAVEVVMRSAAGARRVRIATDQPIRLGNGTGIAATPERGMPVMPGEQPFDLGVIPAGSRLFAVVPAGGVTANVTVSSQLVE